MVANFLSPQEFSYFDERIERFEEERLGEFVFLYTPFFVPFERIREIAHQLEGKGKRVILFGPLISKKPEMAGEFSHIRGSLLNIFPEVKEDCLAGRLGERYDADFNPIYLPPRWDLRIPGMEANFHFINFILGCRCPEEMRPFCSQAIYYRDRVKKRGKEEILGEVVTLPYKRIFLLDDDISSDRNYYYDIFSSLWQFRKEWVVNASKACLKEIDFLRFLGKVGVRILYLREDFLTSEEIYSLNQELVKEKRWGVKRIQSERILVGIRIALFLKPDVDYEPIFRHLVEIDPDFIEILFFQDSEIFYPVYHPLLTPKEPLWLKASFYSVRAIVSRLLKRPRRVGLYTTLFYSLPLNLSYRQNFLEGIPYPP